MIRSYLQQLLEELYTLYFFVASANSADTVTSFSAGAFFEACSNWFVLDLLLDTCTGGEVEDGWTDFGWDWGLITFVTAFTGRGIDWGLA